MKRVFLTPRRKMSPQAGKGRACQSCSPVHDQPTPAKTEAPVVESASKAVTPSVAEQSVPAGKEVSKDKDASAPPKEGTPPGKDEK